MRLSGYMKIQFSLNTEELEKIRSLVKEDENVSLALRIKKYLLEQTDAST